jgi:benzoylformate decarboxylase
VGIEARRRLIAERKADSDRVAAAQLKADWEAVPIKPSRVMHELGKAMPPETMLLDESVNSASHLRRYVDFAGENTYFTYKGGALGWGIGAALGAKLARPDRPALAVVGDGSALFGIQALWSVQRSGLPLVTVVLNNQTYMAVKSGIAAYRGAEVRPYVGVDLGENDFARLAEAFGLVGRTVDRPEQLAPAFEQAFASDRAVVIDVKIDPLDTGYGRPPLSPGK